MILVVVMYAIFNSDGGDLEFIEAVNNDAISANILLINVTEESGSISFSAGQSGVIFRKGSKKHYALTALHGIPLEHESNDTKLIVLGYNQPTYGEADINVGIAAYYSQFPEATLEYYDEAYDLAVISFSSEDEYVVLSVATGQPEYNEPVAVIGNPHEYSRNIVTTGRITSKKPVSFGDTAGENQHGIIEHSAKIFAGSSGSALINKDMEIVGINLGASENIFHKFVKGKAMPCDKILEFLSGMNME